MAKGCGNNGSFNCTGVGLSGLRNRIEIRSEHRVLLATHRLGRSDPNDKIERGMAAQQIIFDTTEL
jgi:hypothetical protein